jgi:thiosulfate/3-mercaptopyruvate sulfurtransferase
VTPVDVRPPDEYRSGHVPSAVNIPFDRFRTESGDDVGKLPGPETFSALLGERGVDPETTLVAYDDSFGVYAARFFVTARVYGHDSVRVADGDFTAWREAYPTDDTTPTRELSSSSYPTRRVDRPPVLDSDEFAAVVESGATVVDTRVKYEYRVAHVPGAVGLNWRTLVDDETRGLRSEPEIERVFEERGITPDEQVALYCNTARRLSFVYAVLAHLGYDDVVFYEGGLGAWADAGYPVETGA